MACLAALVLGACVMRVRVRGFWFKSYRAHNRCRSYNESTGQRQVPVTGRLSVRCRMGGRAAQLDWEQIEAEWEHWAEEETPSMAPDVPALIREEGPISEQGTTLEKAQVSVSPKVLVCKIATFPNPK